MCCLFGLIDTRNALSGKDKSKLLHILASESEARGTDATGIAYNVGKQLYIHKRPVPGRKLQIRVRDDTVAVMGHTRMTTQGRASRNRNNHPFLGRVGKTPFALAHNGVLFNDKQLRRTMGLPKTKIETDTYIAVQLLVKKRTLDFNSLRYMAEQVEGSFTFTILDGADNLFIVKGDSPLCLYWFPEQGLYLYNSTEEILNRALQRLSLPLGEHTHISVNCGDLLRIAPSGEISRKNLITHFCFTRIHGFLIPGPDNSDMCKKQCRPHKTAIWRRSNLWRWPSGMRQKKLTTWPTSALLQRNWKNCCTAVSCEGG